MKGHPLISRWRGGWGNFRGKLSKRVPCGCCHDAKNHKHHNSLYKNDLAKKEMNKEINNFE